MKRIWIALAISAAALLWGNFVLDITILFENAVHTLGRYGHLLRAT
jgi:hypothetical protein